MNLVYIDIILLILLGFSASQQIFSEKFNFYGITSVISVSIYFAMHSIYSTFNIMIFLAFVAAIIFIVLELFVPGGILGILGIATLLYSLVAINGSNQYITLVIIIAFVLFVVLSLLNIYLFKKEMLFLNRLILNDSLKTEDGYVANKGYTELINKELLTYTDLRPAGIAIKDKIKYDVVSEGDFIDKNTIVVVSEVVGMRIVVKKK